MKEEEDEEEKEEEDEEKEEWEEEAWDAVGDGGQKRGAGWNGFSMI